MIFGSQHFGGRGACQSSRMGTRRSDKQFNFSHGPAQTKQQVGQCILRTLLVHRLTTSKHGLTRLITAQTWGKSSPFPLQYSLCLAMERTPKCHFVPGFPPEIPKIRIPVTLEAHNLVCKSSIEVRFKTNFYFLLRAFQRYVARHLHTRKSRRFQLLMVESQIGNLTFSPSFGHNLCFKYSNGSCNPILDTYVLRNFQ